MRDVNPIIAVLAVIGGLVVLGFLLRVAFGLLPLLVLIAIGVGIYLFFQQQAGRR